MHERHEAKLDRELAPVYERIAQFCLNRASVIPGDITQSSSSVTRTSRLYDSLKEESDAMIEYFRLMQDASALASAISNSPGDKDWKPVTGGSAAPSADDLQAIMMQDYVTLAGKSGPALGRDYPAAKASKRDDGKPADRPFEGSSAKRAPELGFLSLRRDLVVALSPAGLRWGAIDFGGKSGDVMHFDDGNGAIAAKVGRARRAAKALMSRSQGLSLSLEDGGPSCPPDVAIDDVTCLLFSAAAPPANQSDCHERAVWTYLPSPRPDPFSVLIYLHGMNNSVVVDTDRPGGRPPGWSPKNMPGPFSKGGATAAGPKYDLGNAAQNSLQKPLVLIPEVALPGKKFWGSVRAGGFPSDTGLLHGLVDDCYGKLASLNRPSGGTYLEGGAVCPAVKRLFLAGHSGGGLPLGHAATSALAMNAPTDLWLMDCTYNFGVDDHFVQFCRHWKAWVDPNSPGSDPQNRLGNDANSSRVVIITTQDPDTTGRASSMINTLTTAWDGPGGRLPAMSAQVRERQDAAALWF